MSGHARIALTLAGLAALCAGSLTTAGTATATADTTPTPVTTDGVWGIDYAGGFLTSVENTPSGYQWLVGRRISADGSTVLEKTYRGMADTGGIHPQRVPCDAGPRGCVPMRSFGNTWVGAFAEDTTGRLTAQVHLSSNSMDGKSQPAVTGGRFVDATGRYYVYQASSTGKQYVDAVNPFRYEDVRLTRSITAASVWGSTLWTPGTGNGVVTGYGLETKKTVATVSTGAPCTVKELQVVGRWIYWNCGPTGAAGVYDRTAKKNIKVPSGPALVGDGYLVQHDRTTGTLMLTDFHTGTAAVPRAIADLPAGQVADQRRLTWSVDKFGGDIAYVGPDDAIRIVPSGVPTQSLTGVESDPDDSDEDPRVGVSGSTSWDSLWQLSKPADWTFTVKDAHGHTDRTIKGSGASAAVDWDGTNDAGGYPLNGPKTWTLTATAVEGSGTYTTSGKFGYTGGTQGFHDQNGYSYGELATLGSTGGLALHATSGAGRFTGQRAASGWAAGTVALPFGDMNGDRCAEMLTRMPNGELRRYDGKCGDSYRPSDKHTSLGTGWNAYNVITAPGDLTGDGRTDLLARKSATGDVYLFANDGAGRLKAGVKIRTWSAYTKIVGAGDLNGDGFGDVLAVDKAGTLWRYDGTGAGRVKERVQVAAHWNASYNAVVGVGDITGDGKNDLVMRDTAGNLYRQTGTGKGTFAARVRIATGWQHYKGLF
ncbi:FG-GAP repeat domain-containing protein [Streptomyces sp. NPDC090080]|uniref:FG-GAP repeat domain-containing protein n=1 Tax=Streptomyces sp. NPDC090080 TaxID=3365939 RepID=UPI0037FDEE8A